MAACNFDRVIELAGSQNAVDIAYRICAERGHLVIAGAPGYHQASVRAKAPRESVVSLVNVSEQTHEHYVRRVHEAIQAALEGRLDPFPLMSHAIPMGSMDSGFQLTRKRPEGFVKALLRHET